MSKGRAQDGAPPRILRIKCTTGLVRGFDKDTYTTSEGNAHVPDGGGPESLASPGVTVADTPVLIDRFNGRDEVRVRPVGISIWVLGERHVGGDRRGIHGRRSWLE